jgi:hypothetical protein
LFIVVRIPLIKRPRAVVVSAHVSWSERKPAPLAVMVANGDFAG